MNALRQAQGERGMNRKKAGYINILALNTDKQDRQDKMEIRRFTHSGHRERSEAIHMAALLPAMTNYSISGLIGIALACVKMWIRGMGILPMIRSMGILPIAIHGLGSPCHFSILPMTK